MQMARPPWVPLYPPPPFLFFFAMQPALYESIEILEGVMSDETSKMATRMLMRNPYGGLIYAGLFGLSMPHHTMLNAQKTAKQIRSRELQAATGLDFPTFVPLGDVIRELDAERSNAVEEWFTKSLTSNYPTFPNLIDDKGSAALDDLFKDIKQHIVDMGGWKPEDTMMIALILFSYYGFEPTLIKYFEGRVAQGIVPALHRYRLKQKASPIEIDGRNFNVALIMFVMRHATRRY